MNNEISEQLDAGYQIHLNVDNQKQACTVRQTNRPQAKPLKLGET
jgi:hypothetical protein